jgi:hypothetical protein
MGSLFGHRDRELMEKAVSGEGQLSSERWLTPKGARYNAVAASGNRAGGESVPLSGAGSSVGG